MCKTFQVSTNSFVAKKRDPKYINDMWEKGLKLMSNFLSFQKKSFILSFSTVISATIGVFFFIRYNFFILRYNFVILSNFLDWFVNFKWKCLVIESNASIIHSKYFIEFGALFLSPHVTCHRFFHSGIIDTLCLVLYVDWNVFAFTLVINPNSHIHTDESVSRELHAHWQSNRSVHCENEFECM